MTTSLLKKITELAVTRDKEVLEDIKTSVELHSAFISITIFNDHVLIFSEKTVKGHQQINTYFVKGNFKQLPKQEIIY